MGSSPEYWAGHAVGAAASYAELAPGDGEDVEAPVVEDADDPLVPLVADAFVVSEADDVGAEDADLCVVSLYDLDPLVSEEVGEDVVLPLELREEIQDIRGLTGGWGRVFGMSLAPLCLVRGFP